MCDEHYDARMRAFWRALAETGAEEEREALDDELVVKPIVVEPLGPQRAKPKALIR